jgi:hypothetical protein
MRDLLSDALTAESGVTKLHLDDVRDDFLRWSFGPGLLRTPADEKQHKAARASRNHVIPLIPYPGAS